MLKKYGNEKLQVVLLSVDSSRDFYDSRAPKLFEQYGGGEWPSIILPGGFNGALHFGDFGYGKIILDKDGTVHEVNPRDLEKSLEKIFAN